MKIALLTTDNREHHRRYDLATPYFGPAIEAVLQGLRTRPELEVHVVSCTQKPMPAPENLGGNIWFHLLHVPKIGWLRTGYQGCVRAVRKKLRELQPDLVHGQGTERDCSISAGFSGFPSVITIHGNMRSIAGITGAVPFSYDWCAARLERLTIPKAYGVLCNSAFTRSAVESIARRTWLVPNAIQLEFFNPPSSRPPRLPPKILNIGTIVSHKRQLELLEIAAELSRSGYSFELQFIGPANPKDKYAARFLQRIAQTGRDGFATYLGVKSLSQLVDCLDAASALVHLPSAESFGLVVAEALARNLKFFGTNIGGIPDIAANVDGAELFEPRDRDRLRDAIANWLDRGCLQSTDGFEQMQRRYHPSVIAQRHEEIYREVIGEPSRVQTNAAHD